MNSTLKKNRFRVLVVDDDPKIIESVCLILENQYQMVSALNAKQAMEIIASQNIDLVFLDIHLPDTNGLEILERLKDSGERFNVVMLTAVDTAKTAVQAMKLGAFDYLTKPFDAEEIEIIAEKALKETDLKKEIECFRSQVRPTHFNNIVGTSSALQQAFTVVRKAAPTDATILIHGQTGTGKELLARAIHFESLRKDKPFVAINCAGIPENLLETELFGFEKGAFTGAERQKLGKFEVASGGTLFLDEISSLRPEMQGKILRALQQKEIERVGGLKTIPVDLRVIAATNIDLAKSVAEGKFRDDLYYRLNVIPIFLPPLSQRKEDIPSLAQYFLGIYAKKFQKKMRGISEKAMEYLSEYSWPGNIRELENMIERMIVLSESDFLDSSDLPFDVFLKAKYSTSNRIDEGTILKEARDLFERNFISAVLERTEWNQTEAAKKLGIHRNTLILKTDQLGITKKES